MTTTPLPPLPEPDHIEYVDTFDGGTTPVFYYDPDSVREFSQQARADLEAENKRLRQALQNIKHMKTFAIETTSIWCPLATEMVEIASAALENKHD